MLKNKTKIVAILLALFVMCSFTFSFAVNEEDARTVDPISLDDAAVNTIAEENNEDVENAATEGTTEKEMKSQDVYLAGDDITVDYDIDGNLFVMAKSVTITSQIGGDVFVCAENFNLDGGYIYSNLFIAAENATINGIVYDVYGVGSKITIGDQGYVYRDVHITTSALNVYGAIGRNASVAAGKISFVSDDQNSSTANGVIYGNLDYTSSAEIEGLDKYVEGTTNFNLEKISDSTDVKDVVVSIITSLVFLLVVYLLIKWIKPSIIEKSGELLGNKLPQTVLTGFVGLLIVPIVAILLFILNLTATLGFLLLGIYFLIISVSTAMFVIGIANLTSKKRNNTNKYIDLLTVLVVGLVLYLLKLIPYVGGFLSFVYVVIGFGLILKQIIPTKAKKEETKAEVVE